eukprot:TRINITY_DN27725_c0_g1_i1.p1 TRINITY_DN27725_c0_g1~~TRINITY_DN27725_c0_g1_i1.p1  ORF type:complete len:458 (+),score=53.29 TRINITY_DN27725_c0_g1_i1:35-1408(+)
MADAQFQLCTFEEIIDNASETILSEWFAVNRPTEDMFVYALQAATDGRPQAFELLIRNFQSCLFHVSETALAQIAEGVVMFADESTMAEWFARHRPSETVFAYAVQERCLPAVRLLLREYRSCFGDERMPALFLHSMGLVHPPDVPGGDSTRLDISSWATRNDGKRARIDLGIVQCLLRAGASANEQHLECAVRRGQTNLVYTLLHAGAMSLSGSRDLFSYVLDVQGASDDNARPELRDTALRIARHLHAFARRIPAGVITVARAKGQHCLAQTLEIAQTQHCGLRYALHALKRSGIPGYLRFDIASCVLNFPEYLRPCDPEPLGRNTASPQAVQVDVSIVSSLLEHIRSAPDPIPFVSELAQEMFALFEFHPASSEDLCQLLQNIKAAIQELSPTVSRQTARELSDALSDRTPSLDFLCGHVRGDAALCQAVTDFFAFLTTARRRPKSAQSGGGYR